MWLDFAAENKIFDVAAGYTSVTFEAELRFQPVVSLLRVDRRSMTRDPPSAAHPYAVFFFLILQWGLALATRLTFTKLRVLKSLSQPLGDALNLDLSVLKG